MSIQESGDTLRHSRSLSLEADLVLPTGYDATEIFQLLDGADISYDLHRADTLVQPTLRWQERLYVGVSGLKRFLQDRDVENS